METRPQEHHSNANAEQVDHSGRDIDGIRESEYLDVLKALRVELLDKSAECELLKIRLNESDQDNEVLRKELDEHRLSVFENNQDYKKTHEEVLKSKKREEDYVKLMSEYLDLEEKTEQYKRRIFDEYQVKTNAINNFECLMSSGAVANELADCKLDLKNMASELLLAQAKVRSLEEDVATKEKTITELRRSFDDAKVTHKHEIMVVQEYIQCLKNTILSHEKILFNYSEQKVEQ